MTELQKLLAGLNPEQREAVTWPKGPVLILAGAGSGKTRVLAYRIAYLIGHKGIKPRNLLAVTFTNKAAEEMAERVQSLLGSETKPLWLGTFHSVCVRILRRDGEYVGCARNFSIFDQADSLSVLKEIIKEFKLSEREYNPKAIRSRISGAKNALVGPENYPISDRFTEQVVRVYAAYNERLRQYNGLDFDDLLLKVVELFSGYENVRQGYSDRFQHILVDEYQDTNRAQYLIVQLLSSKHRNLFVVGDDDQSIYGFRGADINNILDFEKDFPDVKTVRLEQNYRSTRLILNAASSVVRNNVGRMGKELWTENEEGVLAYMRVVVNPKDGVSLKRIVNVPKRGIGPAVVGRLERFAGEQGISLYESILRVEEIEEIQKRHMGALRGLRNVMEKARASADELGAAELMSHVIDDVGYVRELEKERTREAESRMENVRELLSSAVSYEERAEDRSIRGFLAEVSLFTAIDGWNEKQEAVTLMTAHNAKGLEFPVVFISGLEDGLFPHSSSFESPSELEEERRLFYVSLTRAREKVYLSYARERTRFGGSMPSFPSRFLKEIPEDLIDTERSRASQFDVGDIVRHPDWGLAKVLRLEGNGDDARAVLRFEAGFEKIVMLRYAGLTRAIKEDLWE